MRIIRRVLYGIAMSVGLGHAAIYGQKVDPIKISKVSVLPRSENCHLIRDQLSVRFPPPYPVAADVTDGEFWTVEQMTKSGGANPPLHPAKVNYSPEFGYATLIFASSFADGQELTSIKVLLISPKGISDQVEITDETSLKTTPRGQTNLASADDKDSSDIYFNGSYSVIKDSDALFAVDAFAGHMWTLSRAEPAGQDACGALKFKAHYYGKLGFYGEATEKSAASANPDSFLNYIAYQITLPHLIPEAHTGLQRPNFIYRVYGAEYNKTATELNTVTSPLLSIPWSPLRTHANQGDAISKWPLFHLVLGTEFVRVFDSPVAPIGKWHTRGLLGSDFVSGLAPKKNGLNALTLTTSWQLRLPSSPEIFYNDKFAPIDPTTNKKDTDKTPPMLGTQPRHYVDSKLTYNYAKWSGVTFEYTYGSKPPAFNVTDHTFAFGLSLTLKQNTPGRASILRP